MSTIMNNLTFTTPLPKKAFDLATKWQQCYSNSGKSQQVYLNTLAIYAVNFYFQCMDIDTDFDSSESFDIINQSLTDVADLELVDFGKIECRPVLPEENDCYIPAEVWENRLGYLAVRIDESNQQAKIIGFYPSIPPDEMLEKIPIIDFQSLDVFWDYLEKIEIGCEKIAKKLLKTPTIPNQLTSKDLAKIFTQFERIYQTVSPLEKQTEQGRDVLADIMGFIDRDLMIINSNEANPPELDLSLKRELENLAVSILSQVGEIYGNNQVETKQENTLKFSVIQWFQEQIDDLAEQIGWLFADNPQFSLEGAKGLKGDNLDKITINKFKEQYLKLPLTIAGQNYELRVFCTDIELNQWRFELRNQELGGKIPAGFKLILLDENGQAFEDNEVIAAVGNDEIGIEFQFESGEGIIWKIEPMPDNYQPIVMYF